MDRLGAWPTALASGASLFLGWALFYAGSLKLVSSDPIVMGLYYSILQMGAQGGFYVALVGNLANFKLKNRGTVTGILVSMYGLSAFVISQIYQHVFTSSPPSLFAFMAVLTVSLCITGACAINSIKPQSTKLAKAQRLLLAQSAINADGGVTSADEINSGLISENDTSLKKYGASEVAPSVVGVPEASHPDNEPRYGQLRYLTLLKNIDFWLIAAIGFCTAGSGLNFITSVGSIAESWGLTAPPYNIPASTFTSVLAICNCLGRILYGVANDALRSYFRNVVYLVPISLIIMIAQIIMVFWNSVPALFLAVLLIGVNYGGFFATQTIIFNRYFGDKNYSSNLGFSTLVVSLSGLIFGQISGRLADHFSKKGQHCFGTLCYRYTFIIGAALSIVSLICAVIIIQREKRDDERKLEGEEYGEYEPF